MQKYFQISPMGCIALAAVAVLTISPTLSAKTLSPLRQISSTDNADILDQKRELIKNAFELDSKTPRVKNLGLQPWAGGHWKMDAGMLGNRYADPKFQGLEGWEEKHNYILKNSVAIRLKTLRGRDRERFIDQLSPAEKYDLLIGDDQQTLTTAQWAEGEARLLSGTLAHWMGICEGTAAAGALYPEPLKEVRLVSPQGDEVRLHILDIKALASLLWSSYNVTVPVAGNRCMTSHPRKDSRGIIMDEDCFDSNPGTWHIAVLNYLGQRQQPFFVNRSNSQEVWNVPIIGYQLSYFNIQTKRHFRVLTEAMLPIEKINNDKFGNYRSSQASYIVGVDVVVKMTKGTEDNRDEVQSSPISEVNYLYDLELSANGTILGGEWRSDAHPDFIWAINDPSFKPFSRGDFSLMGHQWNGQPFPNEWLEAARVSSRENQPLELVVSKLVEWSAR